MSFETLKTIITAEEQADLRLSVASSEAKKILAEAESEGRRLILTAESEAEEAVEIMMNEAELKITAASRDISSRTAETCRKIRLTAHDKMPEAVNLVIERIVRD